MNNKGMSKALVPQNNEIIIYTTPGGDVRVEVLFQDETFWMNINRIADLFGTSKQDVSYHLQNIYDTGELKREATVKEILTVQVEGRRKVSRKLDFFNLDAIIAVGYRVNSKQATQFRIWATATLREFITKGFVLDDERLKLNKRFGKDYFDELLERIREIRASERLFYLIGSHIVPWAANKGSRLDPQNGLYLCVFHDKAFDFGYISLSDDFQVLLSPKVRSDNDLNTKLSPHGIRKINLPKRGLKPKTDYLKYHHDRFGIS